ncbi:hypothetical protein OG909_14840 [Streptomyces sp. NBC_01754]|uniref:hypothetical protein n=1 Tax=Streptomyces sp. NBC_01754 TaxID=2975930 RepID=UPI002DDC3B29|nr:hypothetical protein [Streptomyces sp. NBC_01754]WSC93457.1 hypothetical protein OG909_14840 [Streptomyces sp. NBC_01754]
MTQHGQAVDAVGARDDAGGLGVRCRTRPVFHPGQLQLLRHEPRQTAPLGQPQHRNQPGQGDQIRITERSGDRRRRVGNLHLGSALLIQGAGSLKNSHHRRSQGISSFQEELSTDAESVDQG